MKNFIGRCCCFALVILLAGCNASLTRVDSSNSKAFAGTWKGKDSFGQTMELTLKNNGSLVLKVTGRQSFSKTGTYSIDSSKSPAHFDIKLDDREIQTICELTDSGQFIFESIGSGARPARFGDQKIVMERR